MTASRRVIAFLLLLGCGIAGVARAQDAPVVFVHGLNSSGDTWQSAADRLQQYLAIAPHRPSLTGPSYGDQANELQARLGGLPGTTVAVGHSNGGIVSRHWSALHPLSGVLTLSTPHHGAPLMAHVGDWVNFNLMAFDLIGAVGTAFGGSYDDSWWVYTAVQGVLSLATQGARDGILQLAGLLALHRWLPIFPEMVPGSGYLSMLNSGANLAREAASIPSRVGIVNVAHNFYWGGVFRAIWPQYGDHFSNALHASAAVLDYYAGVLWSSSNPRDWSRAQRLSTVAWWLWVHEEFWCRTVSDPSPGAYGSSGYCAENDTLVPAWSQVYPNATNILRRRTPVHKDQTTEMAATVYEALVTFMRVYPRGSTPPGQPPPPPAPPPPGPVPRSPNALYGGEMLTLDNEIRSDNGRFVLVYQPDGNLVLYVDDGQPIWASQTAGTSNGYVTMQRDGNLVIYNARGEPMWHTSTHNHPGSVLALQDDGNLVIYRPDGTPIWASGTAGR